MLYLHVCKPFWLAVFTSSRFAILIWIASHASLAVVALKLYSLVLLWTNNTPEMPSFVGTKKEPTWKCKSINSQTIKSKTVHLNQQKKKERNLPRIWLTSRQAVLVNKKNSRQNANQTLDMTAEHATKTAQKLEHTQSVDGAERYNP